MGIARYTVVIEWDQEEELYIATIPALSVGSYGVSMDEALAKIREAAEVTIEGLKAHSLPVPQGNEETGLTTWTWQFNAPASRLRQTGRKGFKAFRI